MNTSTRPDSRDISIIIPWCDRREIRQSLTENVSDFLGLKAEVMVVCCGGNFEALKRLTAPYRGKVSLVSIPARKFNKSLAINVGVGLSRGAVIVLLDCDIIASKENLKKMIGVARIHGACGVSRVLDYSEERAISANSALWTVTHQVTFRFARDREVTVERSQINLRDGSRSGPGILAIQKQLFERVDGANSTLKGWGWEDNDLILRVGMATGKRLPRRGTVFHVGKRRPGSTGDHSLARALSESTNFRTCLALYAAGIFTGTFSSDNATHLTGILKSKRRLLR
jgi:predicted glycosyltransferase involved in capsule biosynthesis